MRLPDTNGRTCTSSLGESSATLLLLLVVGMHIQFHMEIDNVLEYKYHSVVLQMPSEKMQMWQHYIHRNRETCFGVRKWPSVLRALKWSIRDTIRKHIQMTMISSIIFEIYSAASQGSMGQSMGSVAKNPDLSFNGPL